MTSFRSYIIYHKENYIQLRYTGPQVDPQGRELINGRVFL